MKRLWVLAFLILTTLAFAGDKDKDKNKDQVASVTIKVVKAFNGKPMRFAAVVLHAVNDKGHQEEGGLNLKTDLEGVTSYDGVPYGKIRVQVIVPGFQTYGQDFEIDQPKKEIVVKLQSPQKQYSIYDHGGTAKDVDNDKKN